MKVYFYHTQDTCRMQREWEEGRLPGHLLYGATHLHRHGIDVILHRHKKGAGRWRMMWDTARQVWSQRKNCDAVYATSFRGLEVITFLRALRLFPKPVIIWHHQPVVTASNPLRELVARFFYRGFDHLIFFSRELLDISLRSCKARAERMSVVPWGADLDFYDRLVKQEGMPVRTGFISTGKEHRDMPTLIEAFRSVKAQLDIYVSRNNGGEDYDTIIDRQTLPSNVHVHFTDGFIPYELSRRVCRAAGVAICCKETTYTVGLTTLVEALALGIPVLCSRNPHFAFDIDRERVGLSIPYYNKEAWTEAARWLAEHPEESQRMGKAGRELAEKTFNLENCAREVARILLTFSLKRNKK